MKVELLVATHAFGALKAGDVMTVCPAGWAWGKRELEQFVVIPIEYDGTLEQAKAEYAYDSDNATVKKQVDLAVLQQSTEIDNDKLINGSIMYQPLLDQSRFTYFTGDKGKHAICCESIDCGVAPTVEIVLPKTIVTDSAAIEEQVEK